MTAVKLATHRSSSVPCMHSLHPPPSVRPTRQDDVWDDFETLDKAKKIAKLKAFGKFDNTTEALEAAASLVDSKLSKGLKKFLKKNAEGETLGVVDAKLGSIIKEKLGIPCIYSSGILELSRGLRNQLEGLLTGFESDLKPMSLGLSHSLSRYKLKFSPDKVDTMIVQAIGLLDDLDKVCGDLAKSPSHALTLTRLALVRSLSLLFIRSSTRMRCGFASGTAGTSRR